MKYKFTLHELDVLTESNVAAEVRANKAEQDAVNCQQAVYNGTNTWEAGNRSF